MSSIGHRTCEIMMKEKNHPCHMKLCAFRWLISRPQILNLRSRNQIRGKLLLSRKLRHFRWSRFSQCFIPSTSPHYLSQYANNYFVKLPIVSTAFKETHLKIKMMDFGHTLAKLPKSLIPWAWCSNGVQFHKS